MSTGYITDSPIPVSEILSLRQGQDPIWIDETAETVPGQSYCLTDGRNYLWVFEGGAQYAGFITSATRYGGNDVEGILDYLGYFVSEYEEDEFWDIDERYEAGEIGT